VLHFAGFLLLFGVYLLGTEQLLVDLILLIEEAHVEYIFLAKLANVELDLPVHAHEHDHCCCFPRALLPGGFSFDGQQAMSKKTGLIC
jgi:hypothetical protein